MAKKATKKDSSKTTEPETPETTPEPSVREEESAAEEQPSALAHIDSLLEKTKDPRTRAEMHAFRKERARQLELVELNKDIEMAESRLVSAQERVKDFKKSVEGLVERQRELIKATRSDEDLITLIEDTETYIKERENLPEHVQRLLLHEGVLDEIGFKEMAREDLSLAVQFLETWQEKPAAIDVFPSGRRTQIKNRILTLDEADKKRSERRKAIAVFAKDDPVAAEMLDPKRFEAALDKIDGPEDRADAVNCALQFGAENDIDVNHIETWAQLQREEEARELMEEEEAANEGGEEQEQKGTEPEAPTAPEFDDDEEDDEFDDARQLVGMTRVAFQKLHPAAASLLNEKDFNANLAKLPADGRYANVGLAHDWAQANAYTKGLEHLATWLAWYEEEHGAEASA